MNASVRTRNKVLEIIQNNKDISFMDIVNKMKDEMGTKISSSSMDNFIKMIRRVLEWWEESGKIVQVVNRRNKEGMFRMNENFVTAKNIVSDTMSELGVDVSNMNYLSLNEEAGLDSNDLAKLRNSKTNAFPANHTMNYKEKFDWILRNGVKMGDWVGQSFFYYDGNVWMLKSGKATNDGSIKDFRRKVNKSVVTELEPKLTEIEKMAKSGKISMGESVELDEALPGILKVKPNSKDWMSGELLSTKHIRGKTGTKKFKIGDNISIHPFDGDRFVGAVDKNDPGTYFCEV